LNVVTGMTPLERAEKRKPMGPQDEKGEDKPTRWGEIQERSDVLRKVKEPGEVLARKLLFSSQE